MNKKSFEKLVAGVEEFTPEVDGKDRRWAFFLKEGRRWTRLHVVQYEGTYYFSGSGFDSFEFPAQKSIDFAVEQRVPGWTKALAAWKKAVARDPIEAQSRLFRKLPLRCRMGVIERKNARILLPAWMPIASEFSAVEKKEILEILGRHSREPVASMTLERFLEYCRVAYAANPSTFRKSKFQTSDYRRSLSGREYYKRYADGRDGGLLKIAPQSPKAFERWYESGERSGCHPWEIYRGGNSTHIDLYVARPSYGKGWEVGLTAMSSTRMVETCRIARALAKAGLPFVVQDAESYIERLLDQDWVGIMPQDDQISYAWQSFPQEWGVRDCVHLDWFYEESAKPRLWLNRHLRWAVHWLPEEISAFLK